MSFDTVEENRAFADKFDFPFLLLSDTERAMGVAYGAADSPDARGPKRISYLIDPTGAIAEVYAKVDVSVHPEHVLNDIG